MYNRMCSCLEDFHKFRYADRGYFDNDSLLQRENESALCP